MENIFKNSADKQIRALELVTCSEEYQKHKFARIRKTLAFGLLRQTKTDYASGSIAKYDRVSQPEIQLACRWIALGNTLSHPPNDL